MLRQVVNESSGLAGYLRYEWYRSADTARGVFIYGEFESEEAFARYRRGRCEHLLATVLDQG